MSSRAMRERIQFGHNMLIYFLLSGSLLFQESFSQPHNKTGRSTICPVLLPFDPPSGPDLLPTSYDNRIINGDLASIRLRRSLVSLIIPKQGDGVYFCTGALLSPAWVITAAHCLADLNTRVRIGVERAEDVEDSQTQSVDLVINHADYDEEFGMRNDIAVLRLSSPAPASAIFMKVNVNNNIPPEGSAVRAIGYGNSQNDGDPEEVAGYLRQVDVPVSFSADCRNAYFSVDLFWQVCAGYRKGGCDACQGDSGGPLVQYNRFGDVILVGITSFGNGCAQEGYPGVYVRTAPFRSWLDKNGVTYEKARGVSQVYLENVAPSAPTRSKSITRGGVIAIVIGSLLVASLVIGVCLLLTLCRKERTQV